MQPAINMDRSETNKDGVGPNIGGATNIGGAKNIGVGPKRQNLEESLMDWWAPDGNPIGYESY